MRVSFDHIFPTLVDIIVEVHEQICGDPSCAPVDTVFLLLWSDGAGKGMFALPLAPDEVTKEDVEDIFPVCINEFV